MNNSLCNNNSSVKAVLLLFGLLLSSCDLSLRCGSASALHSSFLDVSTLCEGGFNLLLSGQFGALFLLFFISLLLLLLLFLLFLLIVSVLGFFSRFLGLFLLSRLGFGFLLFDAKIVKD